MYFDIKNLSRSLHLLREAVRALQPEMRQIRRMIEHFLVDPKPTALIQCTEGKTILTLRDTESSVLREEVFDGGLDAMAMPESKRLAEYCAGRELYVSLKPSDTYRVELLVPERGAGNIYEAAKYCLLTESPIELEGSVFDMKIPTNSVQRQEGERAVEVALCRRQALDRLKVQLAEVGVSAAGIGFASSGMKELEFTFERLDGAARVSRQLRRNALLALGPVLTFLFALLATWMYSAWKADAVRSEIASLSDAAEKSARLLARRTFVSSIDRELNDSATSVPMAALLNEIGRTMPKSAWLTEVRIESGKIRLVGNGKDPSGVVKSLASLSSMFGARLESVASASPTVDLQRFEIEAEIRGGGGK